MNSDTSALARAVRTFDRAQRKAPAHWEFGWDFGRNDTVFAGHFPHQPILPGVFLLEMAQRAAEWALRESLGGAWRVNRVDRMRFTAPVRPGDDCALQVQWDGAAVAGNNLALSVNFSKAGVPVAHGSLRAAVTSASPA